MNILDFTAEKLGLIAIYAKPTHLTTAATIVGAMPDIDAAFKDIAASSAARLAEMTDKDFEAISFVSAGEDELDDAA